LIISLSLFLSFPHLTPTVPFTPTHPSAAYLQKILAQRSIPTDDEPKMSEKQSRRGKLLPNPGYYPGFAAAEAKNNVTEASTWPWTLYENGDAESNSQRHAQRRRAIWRRLFLVFTLILAAAYGAYQMSYLAHYYANAALYAPQPTWNDASNSANFYSNSNSGPEEAVGIDSWIKKEAHSALRAVLANIGPVVGAADGIVVASPSTGDSEDEPDYYVRREQGEQQDE
jgi:hypothetical protein